MNDVAWWLLDLTIDGVVYRWSHDELEIIDGNDTVTYRAGLGAFNMQLGEEDVTIELTDPSVDWPLLASEVEGGTCTIRRWEEGTELGAAVVYTAGKAIGVVHGTREEPISFEIGKPEGSFDNRGKQAPGPLERISLETWPNTIVDDGAAYPILFGTPGNLDDIPFAPVASRVIPTPAPVMPVPVAFWTAPSLRLILSVGTKPNPESGSLYVENRSLDERFFTTQENAPDALNQDIIRATVLSTDPTFPATATERSEFRIGFKTGGGGQASTAYEAIEFLLNRYGPDTVDWVELERVRDDLSLYRVDSWIDDPVQDPWVWIESLIEKLPFELRTSARGRYLERIRFNPDGTQVRRAVEVGVDAERVGGRRFAAGGLNEFTARYRPGVEVGEWLGRVIVTGDVLASKAQGALDPSSDTNELVKIQRDGRCAASFARWGLRQAELIDLDWTWDTGTALAAIEWRVERDAVSAWLSDYWIQNGHDLRVGDEIRITDDDMLLDNALAIVVAPPVANRTDWARISLRYRA